jgi:ribonuclease HII
MVRQSSRAGRPAPSSGGRRPGGVPTLRLERRLLRSGVTRLGAMDEVGRGSPAGPVHVGLVVLDPSCSRPPSGIRDSKLLAATARERLVPRIESWVAAWAVGVATSDEIDALGLTGALRLAGTRALGQVDEPPDHVLLDGNYDWLTPVDGPRVGTLRPVVQVQVKADLTCTSVAAASILAKVARDAVMVGLASDYPDYAWDANKGYATEAHFAAIRRHGVTPHHRKSWRLPLVSLPG